MSDLRPSGLEHVQAPAQIGGRLVLVDEPLVPLMEALDRCGVTTLFSCQEVASAHGAWLDEPEKPRFYVVIADVEDLRRLIPRLVGSDRLARSISPSLGAPRWEFRLNVKQRARASGEAGDRPRLQVAIFVPVEQLGECVAQLSRFRDQELADANRGNDV